MSHTMVDTETLGKRAGCVILSLGAVTFDPMGADHEQKEFYRTIDLQSAIDVGLHVDPETVAWWQQQSKEAQDALSVNTVPIKQALQEFVDWWKETKSRYFWCHGATFDAPIVTEALRLCDIVCPWDYWNARCTRTLYMIAHFDPKVMHREGTYHNALDDAQFQTKCVREAYRRLFPEDRM